MTTKQIQMILTTYSILVMFDEPLELRGRVVDRLEEVELRIQLCVGGDHVLVLVFAKFPNDSLTYRKKVRARSSA